MSTTKLWAEVGTWNGDPAMVVMRSSHENGVDEWGGLPEVLHDVPLEFPDGYDPVFADDADLPYESELEHLGYRAKPGVAGQYTVDGYLFEIEAI
jgi:hypothetical protein